MRQIVFQYGCLVRFFIMLKAVVVILCLCLVITSCKQRNDFPFVAAKYDTTAGTNLIPSLLQDMREIERMVESGREDNVQLAFGQRVYMAQAFETLGTNMQPYVREFEKELLSGQNYADAVTALMVLRKQGNNKEAAAILLSGLTNASTGIRMACVSVSAMLSGDGTYTSNAVPLIVPLLDDKSPAIRVEAVRTLGVLHRNPELCLPNLLARVKSDPDFIVRVKSVSAIFSFGTNANVYSNELRKLSELETNTLVQKTILKKLNQK